MDDGSFYVDILDKNGSIIDKKLRKNIVKGVDIYHAVYCVLVTPEGNIAISKIAKRDDMPNLHAGSYGCTAATIKRTGETGDQAMVRALKNELNITTKPEKLYEKMVSIDNTYRLLAVYKVICDVPADYNRQDIDKIVVLTPEKFKILLADPDQKTTGALHIFWEEFSKK